MRQFTIKGAGYASMQEVHEDLAREFSFPAYYGKNLSALYDVLTETDLETEITVDFTGMEEGKMKESLQRMASVIGDAMSENECISLIVVEA